MNNSPIKQKVGAVIIGRNEGERLVACLQSLIKNIDTIVYVDSGSSDNSVKFAQSLGIHVMALDMSIPFTAARARNEGAAYLLQHDSSLTFIQFADGDCEVRPNWILQAEMFLNENSGYAIVCGRRRERFPQESIYNQLCDIEWDTPIGDAQACGGDALIRVSAFRQVNGYNKVLIAGEEPEMCYRLRQQEWKIRRIDAEMTLHDAAITRIGQWWSRAKRAGYAYASSCYLHGVKPEKFMLREVSSIVLWACCIPAVTILLSLYDPIFIAILLLYPLQLVRIAIRCHNPFLGLRVTLFYAALTVVGKFAEFSGVVQFGLNTLFGRSGRLIEYK